MKKRILSMLVLLMVVAAGAVAQTTQTNYKLSVKEGTEDASSWTIGATEAAAGAQVTASYSGSKHVKSVKAYINLQATPLTIEALSDGSSSITVSNPKSGMQYSKNGGEKKSLTSDDIPVSKGDKAQFYGNGTSITSYGGYNGTNFGSIGEVKVYGNIMRLVNEENFATATTLTADETFYTLFKNNTSLTDASGLLLPATTLKEYCYGSMFEKCTNLVAGPTLPATTLAYSCYNNMFYGCTSLTSLTCLATSVNQYYHINNWLRNVVEPGTLYVDANMTTATWNEPSSWKVKSVAAKPSATTGAINLTSTNGTVWTLASMPAYAVELEVEYYDEVTLTDGNDLSALSAYAGQTVNVTYTREFTSGKTSTVCLPFAYEKKAADGSFYAFTNIEKVGSEYVATMTEPAASTLEANTPYLFTPAASSVTFTGTIADVPATFTAGETTSNGWTFKGTYETIQWETAPATSTYGFSAGDANDGIKQGQFVKVGSYVQIQPMRCYLENEGFAGARGAKREAEPLPETIKVRLISANGEVTAIGTMQTKTGEVTLDGEAWYSMDGRRIVGKPSTKGIYVNNGHKMIIK